MLSDVSAVFSSCDGGQYCDLIISVLIYHNCKPKISSGQFAQYICRHKTGGGTTPEVICVCCNEYLEPKLQVTKVLKGWNLSRFRGVFDPAKAIWLVKTTI